MPRDQRLYMTFPIDFLDHPKIAILSDNAIVTFVAMNGYSRVHNLDGRIPVEVTKRKWKARALNELQKNHAERPSIRIEGDDFVIHNYAEHQLTTTDIEGLREKRAEAGAKGGKAAALARANAKQPGSKPVAESESESRSESELPTDVTKDYESSQVSDALVSVLDSIFADAKRAGITDLNAVRTLLVKATGQEMSLRGALELAQAIESKSKRPVNDLAAYVAVTCRNSPAEVQQAFFDLDIEGVA